MGDILNFSPAGRTCRRHYWAGLVLLAFVGMTASEFETYLYGITIRESLFNAATVATSVVGLAVAWLFIALLVRRFHDIDRSGWWALSLFIPFFVPVGVIVMGCLRGSDGANRYGNGAKVLRDPAAFEVRRTPEETVKLLNELAHLKNAGALTAEEYEAQKKRILSGS